MFERALAISHLPCLRREGNGLGVEDRSAAALLAQVVHIGRQAVADVDHGVQGNKGMKLKGLLDAWDKVQVLSQNTPPQGAGYQQPVSRLRSLARQRTGGNHFAEYRDR